MTDVKGVKLLEEKILENHAHTASLIPSLHSFPVFIGKRVKRARDGRFMTGISLAKVLSSFILPEHGVLATRTFRYR